MPLEGPDPAFLGKNNCDRFFLNQRCIEIDIHIRRVSKRRPAAAEWRLLGIALARCFHFFGDAFPLQIVRLQELLQLAALF